jgi:hypothetical protein
MALSMAGANQPVHWFLGDKGVGIQQGTSVWVDLPKSLSIDIKRRIYVGIKIEFSQYFK